MKVLHLTGKDFFGAGRAAYRLHKGLQGVGVDSVMWVGNKVTKDDTVINIHESSVKKFLRKIYIRLEKEQIKSNGISPQSMFSTGKFAFRISTKINALHPDVVHIHWINRGFIRLKDLENIKAPIVISMHDMWYFTGGCHYDGYCGNYKIGCGECPLLKSRHKADVSKQVVDFKRLVYGRIERVTFVALSRWMQKCANESSLLGRERVVNLPNGIDSNEFKEDKLARAELKIGKDKKLILFAAVDALSDANKGFQYITKAIGQLSGDNYELLIIGGKGDEMFSDIKIKVHSVGFVDNNKQLVNYLSAADVVVVPSVQENLSNMIMESLSCATPVVAFDIGGNADMIVHKENGYLANKMDAVDLAEGIFWCTGDKTRQMEISQKARKIVVDNFEITDVSHRYVDLYKQVISQKNA